MMQTMLEELDRKADEVLAKAEKSEELEPDEISAEAEDGEEEEENDTEADDEDADDENVSKSRADETEVLDTVTAMVEVVSKSMGDMQDNVTGMQQFSEQSAGIFAKSLLAQNHVLEQHEERLQKTNDALQTISKALTDGLREINARLDTISAQPAHMRKSVGTYSVSDRDFNGSLRGAADEQRLSKSEILSVLNNELMSGSSVVTADDIVMYESGNTELRPEIAALLRSKGVR